MKKTRFVLFLTIISLSSCASSENPNLPKVFAVDFVSETLKIDNLEAKQNEDYIASLDFINENYNYRLPDNITVYVGKIRLNPSAYTYDDGHIFINKTLINDNLKIYAEWTVIDGYRVKIESDSHIRFYFYKTRDYSVAPIEDTIAIARDLNGNPVMDGTGEINFKYTIDDDYDTDLFWIRGMCDEIEEVDTDIYRIANIESDLRFCVNTKKVYCKDLCASGDYNNNSFAFNWTIKNQNDVDHVKVDIIHDGTTVTETTNPSSYVLNNVISEDLYKFIFTPILKDNTEGGSVEKDMMLSPASKSLNFPRVEITTKDNLLPPYEVASSPSKLNVTAINNNYVQNITKIYDDTDALRYDSSLNYSEDVFNGSKIKVRGNTSTVYSNGKESYKIKLNDEAVDDLLDPFLNRSSQTGGDAYKDKEWLLLNCGNQLNELGGFSLEKSLGMSWIPQCQYVTLFMNNDFKGIYILCEAITEGNFVDGVYSRAPISDSGFIIENDPYGWTEDLTFKTHINQQVPTMEYTFKYPDADKLSYENDKYRYISKYVKDFEERFYASPIEQEYEQYIDVESFARWTVAHDLMHVDDHLGSNMYIYKKDDSNNSKLTAGTTWDFDSAFIGNEDPEHPKGLCYHRSSPFYYIRTFKNLDEFKQDTQNIFSVAKDNIVNDFENYIDYIGSKKTIYDALLIKEALRFGKPQNDFDSQKNQIENYLSVQIQYIKDHPYIDD